MEMPKLFVATFCFLKNVRFQTADGRHTHTHTQPIAHSMRAIVCVCIPLPAQISHERSQIERFDV